VASIGAPFDPVEFEEALAWFRARTPMTREEWDALDEKARQEAFTVSNVADAQIVADVWASLDRAISNGESLEEWKASVKDTLLAAWQGDVANPPWRMETIFRTNGLAAFNAGRLQQMSDPRVMRDRPYWMFDGVRDDRQTEVCERCDGVVLPADHPWWRTHYPLLHFNCRSQIQNLTSDEAAAHGIRISPPSVEAMPGFGEMPAFTAAGAWRPDTSDLPGPIGDVLKTRLPSTGGT